MKSFTAILLTLAVTSTYASKVNFEYYSDANCKTGLNAVTIGAGTDVGTRGACTNLSSPGKSFHIGAPAVIPHHQKAFSSGTTRMAANGCSFRSSV